MIVTEPRTSPMGRPMKLKILQARFHRNGTSGEGFYAVRFHEHRKPGKEYIGILTQTGDDDSKGFCGVVSADGDVSECWMGADFWEGALRQAIRELSRDEKDLYLPPHLRLHGV